MKEFIFKLIGITLGTLVGLLLAELGFRAYHYWSTSDLSAVEIGNRKAINKPTAELSLGQIIQLSPNPRIIYDLIPNSFYRFQNVAVQTSSQGFRDKDYPKQKKKGSKRIIGLGDSVMFAWGVEEDKGYLALVEKQLNKQQDSLSYELINTGVPGYNTSMEVAVLEHKFDLNEIDLVILNFVGNDFDLPDFIRKKPAYFGIKKSFILQYFGDNKGQDKRLGGAPFDKENWRFQRKPEDVPTEYKDMVGEVAYQAALAQLVRLSVQYRFEILVLSHSPYIEIPKVVPQTCTTLGIEFLDLKAAWQEHLQKQPNAIWKIAENDWHPSVEAHHFIATNLQKKLLEMGI